jgi:hypothetical protein
MSFKAFERIDGRIFYAFEGEEHRLPVISDSWDKEYQMIPNNPTVVIATSNYMLDIPMLDSIHSAYELDRILNIEAEMERESHIYQGAIIREN